MPACLWKHSVSYQMILFPIDHSTFGVFFFIALGIIILWMLKDAIFHIFVPASHIKTDSNTKRREHQLNEVDISTFTSKVNADLKANELLFQLSEKLGLNIEVGLKSNFMYCWATKDRSAPHIFISTVGSGAFATPYFSLSTSPQRPTSVVLETSEGQRSPELMVTPNCFALPRPGALPQLTFFEVTTPVLAFLVGITPDSSCKVVFPDATEISVTKKSIEDCVFMARLLTSLYHRRMRCLTL